MRASWLETKHTTHNFTGGDGNDYAPDKRPIAIWKDVPISELVPSFWRIFWPTLLAVSIPLLAYAACELFTTLYVLAKIQELVAR